MKLKIIVAVISFLIVAVSCSKEEDDVLNERAKNEASSRNSSQTEVSLLFNIGVNGVATRAGGNEIKNGTGGETEKVSTCSVILFEGGKVVGAYDGVTATEGNNSVYTLADAKFLVKTGRTYEVYVIGDTKQTFKACKDKAAVEAIAFNADDLSSKVKFGKETVVITKEGAATVEGIDTENTQTETVELGNLTAQIRLKDVVGAVKAGEEVSDGNVQLTKVELLNQNTAYAINREAEMVLKTVDGALADPFTIEARDWNTAGLISGFWAFPNTSAETPTQIRLTFKVGADNSQTRTYTINRPDGEEEGRTTENQTNTSYILPGYIYNLYAKVSLNGDQVECELTCTTVDWLYNEFEVEVEQVEEPELEEYEKVN